MVDEDQYDDIGPDVVYQYESDDCLNKQSDGKANSSGNKGAKEDKKKDHKKFDEDNYVSGELNYLEHTVEGVDYPFGVDPYEWFEGGDDDSEDSH